MFIPQCWQQEKKPYRQSRRKLDDAERPSRTAVGGMHDQGSSTGVKKKRRGENRRAKKRAGRSWQRRG